MPDSHSLSVTGPAGPSTWYLVPPGIDFVPTNGMNALHVLLFFCQAKFLHFSLSSPNTK